MIADDIKVDINGNALHFKNDPHLRPAETKLAYTAEHLNEYKRCSTDIVYFAENYVHINDPNKGRTIVKLFPFQKKLLAHLSSNRYSIVMCARQQGKSMTTAIFVLWSSIFNNDKISAVLANKEKTARKLFNENIVSMFKLLPQWLKPGVYECNKSSLLLENGSGIVTAATSKDGIRGYTISGSLILDEAAYVENFEEFYTSVYPTISASTTAKVILISTPNGYNHFYRMWTASERNKSEYKSFLATWKDHPHRGEKWKRQEIANTSPEQFSQEYDAVFAGANNCLMSSGALNKLSFIPPIKIGLEDCLKIYKDHVYGGKYVVAVDTASGVGRDYSAAVVIRIDQKIFEVVALYKSNTIEISLLPYVLQKVCQIYDNPLLVVENNIADSVGHILLNEIEYPELYTNYDDNSVGIKTNIKTKVAGTQVLKELLENHSFIINSIEIIEELSNFVKKHKTYSAQAGMHDDAVMALVLFAYFTKRDFFKEYAEKDHYQQLYSEKLSDILQAGVYPILSNTEGERFDESMIGADEDIIEQRSI